MKINFNELKEVSVEKKNNGTGITRARMFIDNDCKIIKISY